MVIKMQHCVVVLDQPGYWWCTRCKVSSITSHYAHEAAGGRKWKLQFRWTRSYLQDLTDYLDLEAIAADGRFSGLAGDGNSQLSRPPTNRNVLLNTKDECNLNKYTCHFAWWCGSIWAQIVRRLLKIIWLSEFPKGPRGRALGHDLFERVARCENLLDEIPLRLRELLRMMSAISSLE